MNQIDKKLYRFLYKYYYLKTNYANNHPELFKSLEVHSYADSDKSGIRSEAIYPYSSITLSECDNNPNIESHTLDRFPLNLNDRTKLNIINILSKADNEFEEYATKLDKLDLIGKTQKTRKETGPSDRIIKRNQEIIDKCYALEKKDIKPGVIYKKVAKDYPELKPGSIKRIRLDTDSPAPSKLKK